LELRAEQAYYLLFNGILGDKRQTEVTSSPPALWNIWPAHNGPKVIFGEGCKLGLPGSAVNNNFKQIPYQLEDTVMAFNSRHIRKAPFSS